MRLAPSKTPAACGLQVGADAGAHLAERVPLHARELRDGAGRICVRHATYSLKSRVKRDLGLAQGTASTRTPCSGQATRLVAYSR